MATSPTIFGDVARKVGEVANFLGDVAKWGVKKVGDLGDLRIRAVRHTKARSPNVSRNFFFTRSLIFTL